MIIFIHLVVAIETWKHLSLCSFLYLYQLVVNSVWFSRSFSVKCYFKRTLVYREQSSQRAILNLQAGGACIIVREGGTSWPFFYKLIKILREGSWSSSCCMISLHLEQEPFANKKSKAVFRKQLCTAFLILSAEEGGRQQDMLHMYLSPCIVVKEVIWASGKSIVLF